MARDENPTDTLPARGPADASAKITRNRAG